jgi:MFS family permease
LASVLFILVAAGALAGVLVSGRTSDRLLRDGHTSARLVVAAVAYVLTTVVFIPAVLIRTLAVALPIMLVAAANLGAVNPPVDAARLDVVPSHLWGRAEAVRTVFRQLAQGLAPVLFGLLSSAFGAQSGGFGAGVDTKAIHASEAASHGLQMAFILFSLTLLVAGAALWACRDRYRHDVVAARRSDENRAEGPDR